MSTARDYLRFSQMMLNGGQLDGVRLLSPKTIELMTANHLGDIPMGFGQMGSGFGLGFGLVLDPGEVGEVSSAGEFNWGGLAGARFWIDPQEQLIGYFYGAKHTSPNAVGGRFQSSSVSGVGRVVLRLLQSAVLGLSF